MKFATDMTKGILGAPDSTVLWTDIISQIPDAVLLKPGVRILNVAAGHGTEALILAKRMLSLGVSKEQVNESIYLIDKYRVFTNYLKNSYGFKNVITADFLELETDMKFDVVVGNPPYQGKAALHQQFFNKSIELLCDEGYLAFIQPATPYFNKKSRKKSDDQMMIDNIVKYQSDVTIVDNSAFEGAAIATDLAVTVLCKKEGDGRVKSIKYKSGVDYQNVSIQDINMMGMDPKIYRSIVSKYKKYIHSNGSLHDIVSHNEHEHKANISKLRGHGSSNPDFYTFIPVDQHERFNPRLDFGIKAKTPKEAEHIYDYLRSYVARMGLAILKFNTNQHMGELRVVPLVDFSKTYSDDDLFKMIGLTKPEITAIKGVISNYYDR